MSLSIIVPTKGRETLGRTLESIVHQMVDGDQIVVVTDGEIPHVWDVAEHFLERMKHGQLMLRQTEETHDNGGTQRDEAIKLATGTHLTFMDDDDIYTRDAFTSIRQAIEAVPEAPMIFKMQGGDGNGWTEQGGGAGWSGVLWRSPRLEFGNVGTPMIVVPRVLAGVTSWARHHKNSHDFGFIYEVVTKNREQPVVWRPEVISIVRPSDAEAEREIPREV